MKKETKKLVLAKETLRGLDPENLKEVVGGLTWTSCGERCKNNSVNSYC